jgi:hypothetical protein
MTKSKLTRKRKARQNRPAVHTQGQSA